MSRLAFDAYMTPRYVCDALVPLLGGYRQRVIEPSAGTGNWVQAYKQAFPAATVAAWDVQDFRTNGHYPDAIYIQEDFLETQPKAHADLVLGNPPYKHAEAFVRHSLAWCRPSGRVAFLLRMGFLASRRRFSLLEEHPPTLVCSLGGRPSFTGGGTDRYDYAFIVWDRHPPQITQWTHLLLPSIKRRTS